jgi:hypothetical protein
MADSDNINFFFGHLISQCVIKRVCKDIDASLVSDKKAGLSQPFNPHYGLFLL